MFDVFLLHIPRPMKSMTGYGWGDAVQDGLQSHRGTQLGESQAERDFHQPAARTRSARSPDSRRNQPPRRARTRHGARHAPCRREKQRRSRPHQRRELAAAYTKNLRALARELKLSGDVTLDHLMRAPGVLETDEDVPDAEDFWPAVEKALKPAHGDDGRDA